VSLRGACRCNNITLTWRNIDFSLVPRACGCDYCRDKGAAYVSKSGSAVEVRVVDSSQLRINEHGSRQAKFHECGNCGDVVLVVARIDGDLYCALNVNCLQQRQRFPQAIEVNFSDQSPREKLRRWQQNWCHPVRVNG
tara:strand:- start:604 stop:1017 length:414 start_codon:yes stop_codon:yes gene_type:complete